MWPITFSIKYTLGKKTDKASLEPDILAKNFNMGLVKHEYRSAGADDFLSCIQHQE